MNRLGKTIVLAGIGLVIGCMLSSMFNGAVDPLLAIAFMGIPAGWRFIGRHIGHTFVFGSLPFIVVWLCIKFSLCLIIGWIVLGLDLILSIIEVCSGKELI